MREFLLGGLVVGGLLVACAAGGEQRGPARAGVERLDCAEHADEETVEVAFPEDALVEVRSCGESGCWVGGDLTARVAAPGLLEFRGCQGAPDRSYELLWIAVD